MFIIDGHLFVSSSFFREKKEGGKRDDWSHTKSIFCMLENRVATSSGKVVVKASFFPHDHINRQEEGKQEQHSLSLVPDWQVGIYLVVTERRLSITKQSMMA